MFQLGSTNEPIGSNPKGVEYLKLWLLVNMVNVTTGTSYMYKSAFGDRPPCAFNSYQTSYRWLLIGWIVMFADFLMWLETLSIAQGVKCLSHSTVISETKIIFSIVCINTLVLEV